jgi:hypothetical protein
MTRRNNFFAGVVSVAYGLRATRPKQKDGHPVKGGIDFAIQQETVTETQGRVSLL